MENGCKIKIS